MGDLIARERILHESDERTSEIHFGDPITNICAGDGNPRRHSYFVGRNDKSRKNKYGFVTTDRLVKCTDRKGKFWSTDIKVIHPGHLDEDQCRELFDPVWEAEYGAPTAPKSNTQSD